MNGKEQDFMGVMLNVLQDAQISGYDSDTIIKATCLNLILAGSDTTMINLIWALSLLLNHQMELKKVQDELDTYTGKDRNVEESDISKLVYLQAVVKETAVVSTKSYYHSSCSNGRVHFFMWLSHS